MPGTEHGTGNELMLGLRGGEDEKVRDTKPTIQKLREDQTNFGAWEWEGGREDEGSLKGRESEASEGRG